MASNFDSINYGGHGVAESTLMLATLSGGHFYNLVSTSNIDNGSVASVPTPEKYKDDDTFEAVKPTVKGKIVLILTAPKIYSEYSPKIQEEDNFYNGKGEVMRAYEVYETDRFSLSKEAFDTDAIPKKGAYVVVKADSWKLTTTTTEPTTGVGFVGYILKENPNGTFDVFVKKNTTVA